MGHAESAAGISGLTKVVLQLYHKTLVPSLHAEKINPYLGLENSPFYVQSKLEGWQEPENHRRRAGISSFGATGSNAHVIVEEYPKEESRSVETGTFIVPLSAKNEERLLAYAQRLLTFLARKINLADLTYTLQVGREAFEERVAFVVKDQEELVEKLRDFLSLKKEVGGIWRGRTKRQLERVEVELLDLDALPKLWVQGSHIDWKKLYGKHKPRRIHLPTYPFAKERYWVPEGKKATDKTSIQQLHPLLHLNSSDLTQQRFSSIFSGKEPFFADHIVRGKKILPGVAYLEMARAAVERSIREKRAVQLRDIVWLQPVTIDEDRTHFHIGLYPENDRVIHYEIYSEQAEVERVIYSQGQIELHDLAERSAPSLDIEMLRKNCDRYELASESCYQAYSELGIEFGPSHRAIEKIFIGRNELLAKLAIPSCALDTLSDYFLHPSLMDAALQASIGMRLSKEGKLEERTLMLPFAMESIDIYGRCTPSMWAHIKPSQGSAQDGIQKIDIDLCDEQGRLAVRMRELSARALGATIKPSTLLFEPHWEQWQERSSLDCPERKLLLLESESVGKNKGEDFTRESRRLFKEIQTLLQGKIEVDTLLQVVVNAHGDHLLSALSGLLKTAHLENPHLLGQIIEIEPSKRQEALKVIVEGKAPCYKQMRIIKGRPYFLKWNEFTHEAKDIPWRDRGVYLITGGLGAIGLLFAEEITRKAKDPVLILTGRSPLKRDLPLPQMVYRQVDVANREQIECLMREIETSFGPLNGILHCAGITRDNFIIKKSEEEVEAVLAPKVAGTVNLDEASQHMALDLFALFSSGTGAVGNAGQADYAAANAFMNSYADYRYSLGRSGRSLSILWPLWQEGGMQIGKEMQAVMREKSGMVALPTECAINAFYQALASDRREVMVVGGDAAKIRAFLAEEPRFKEKAKESPSEVQGEESLQRRAEEYFKELLSSVIKLPASRIDAAAAMEQYGIDSLMIIQMTTRLEQLFGSLPKTLFFEYQSIQELTRFFMKKHKGRLIQELGVKKENLAAPVTQAPKLDRPRLGKRFMAGESRTEDIAIIGLAGRYPKARNVDEFWENLKGGKDCIEEIPKERWDYTAYFDEDKTKEGKIYSKWGGFIDDIDKFDPLFFHISPKDASLIDPQERLFLQCVYETVEDAGYTKESIEREVAVYVGVMYSEYQLYGIWHPMREDRVGLSSNPSSIANRVSYFFNFHGPSIALDTMCSSSLTALHLACDTLKQGKCALAIAGGINLSLHPSKYLLLSQGRFVSSHGRCESFGLGGDGYVPAEGVGAALLKPLARAIADGDQIYGIVKGSAINHGGKTNGYSVPSPQAQAEVIKEALKEARVDPRRISYVEAHGTGTFLGDPIEIAGLTNAFEEFTQDKQFAAIGSAKSNIGHAESAAGMAGLTKVLLQMKYGQLVPSLYSKELNPNIDFSQTPFFVQQELKAWADTLVDGKPYPRLAAISAFGAGGSNAHVLIEEYRGQRQKISSSHTPVIVLSAESREQLDLKAVQLLEALSRYEEEELVDIAYTLQVGREAMGERLGFTCHTLIELKDKLRNFIEGKTEGLFHGSSKQGKEALEIFKADEDMTKIVETWLEKQKYGKALELWVRGFAVDWQKFYRGVKPRRLSLPTYPFAKERYWIERGPEQKLEREKESCFLTKEWRLAPSIRAHDGKSRVLILSSQETEPLAQELAHYFPSHRRVDVNHIESEHESGTFDGLIDLIGCGFREPDSLHWIEQVKGILEQGRKIPLTLLSVSKGLEVHQNQSINLSGASRAGLYRMLQSEYQGIRSRHMDGDPSSEHAELARQIAVEYFSPGDAPEVCYRGGVRYFPFLQKHKFPVAQAKRTFPEGHVLLITGGTRGLGYLCAEHFVKHYGVKKLLLTGLEPLPPRQEWELYKASESPLGKKLRSIQALEKQGALVELLSLRLSDSDALSAALGKICSELGPIGGVIHCAGGADRRAPAFIRKQRESIESVLEPKVKGLQVLASLVRDQPLQFFLLFSSVSAIIPELAVGQSDYAMANAYMDYFAEAHRGQLPIISIQWPSWKETGMGEVKSKGYQRCGLYSLKDAEGVALLDQILGLDRSVALPALIDGSRFEPERLLQRSLFNEEQIKQPLSKREAGSHSLKERAQLWIKSLLSNELKLDPARLDIDKPFQDYGADSVLLAQLLQEINQVAQSTIDPSIAYEYSTVRSLSEWLATTHPEALGSFFEKGDTEQSASMKEDLISEETSLDGIAVVGLSCRFPGGEGVEAYWRLLSEGGSAIQEVPTKRWRRPSRSYAGMLDNVTDFDPSFFQIAEKDAQAMDPQALMVLEEALKMCYRAGYTHHDLRGKAIGVYIGGRSQHRPSEKLLAEMSTPILALGQNYLAANISQFFDLRGPSLVIDSACSSALVGLHMAVQALESGDIEAAIVGGVSLLQSDSAHAIFQRRGILAPGPILHLFDQRASGTIPGEGVGMVLLKRLKQALEDGDQIEAVIKGVAINNDGKTLGATTPSFEAEKAVMREALSKSGKRAEEIGYVEANGSGSIVTDLLELKAIQSIYRSHDMKGQELSLGSIKPNIGHPLSAAGIASFIKVVLMLKHRQFVPFLSAREELAHFDSTKAKMRFCRECQPWSGTTLSAAINSFADGGTNAHLICESWQEKEVRKIRSALPSPELKKKAIFVAASGENQAEEPLKSSSRNMFWKIEKHLQENTPLKPRAETVNDPR